MAGAAPTVWEAWWWVSCGWVHSTDMSGSVPSLGLSQGSPTHGDLQNTGPWCVTPRLACTPKLCVRVYTHTCITINAYTLVTENCLIWSFSFIIFLSALAASLP